MNSTWKPLAEAKKEAVLREQALGERAPKEGMIESISYLGNEFQECCQAFCRFATPKLLMDNDVTGVTGL
jgi:hypothetical protein